MERYVALIADLKPQRIFELGILQGGNTLFFAELARPRRIAAIDRLPLESFKRKLQGYVGSAGLADVVRLYGEVDQADRLRLAGIVDEAFGGAALDLVVDDCSHLYEPTRASFNELFPRFRPDGAYVIEDWRWAHVGPEYPQGLFPGEVPLTRLVFEVVLALPCVPGLIAEISVGPEAVVIRRGDARIDPSTFDVSTSPDSSGRALLPPA